MNYSRFESITPEMAIAAYRRMGYTLFTDGDYNLNIFGIRNTADRDSEYYNDCIGVLYKVNGKWVVKKYDATTDPSVQYRQEPMNSAGCAILVPGYFRSGFRRGKHQGKYEALVQNTKLPLYRDNNKDDKLDFDSSTIVYEMAGINIHRTKASGGATTIGLYSAGCQAIQNSEDFKEFMNLVDTSAEMYGETFSYALFLETDFFGD